MSLASSSPNAGPTGDPSRDEAPSIDSATIDELLGQVGAGDCDALTALYHQTCDVLFSIVRAVLQDFTRSEEVTQEVYVQIWLTGAKRFDPNAGSAWAYLKTVARRRAIDQLRQREAHRRHDTILGARTESESADLAEAAVTRLHLNAALQNLGERSNRVLTLYYFLDRSYAEIATLLSMPIGTVKTHHHRALQALRIQFDGPSSEP